MFKRMFLMTIALILCAATVHAAPMGDRVPGDALVYVGWRGATQIGPEYDKTRLKEILEATDLDELLGPYLLRLTDRIGMEDPQAGAYGRVLAEAGQAFWSYPSALYVGPPTEQVPVPTVAILCAAGDAAPQLAEQWNTALVEVAESGAPVYAQAVNGTAALIFGMPTPAQLARMGLQEAETSAPALQDNVDFKSTGAQIKQDGVLTLYVDLSSIVGIVDAKAQEFAVPPQEMGGPPPMGGQHHGPDQEFAEKWPGGFKSEAQHFGAGLRAGFGSRGIDGVYC